MKIVKGNNTKDDKSQIDKSKLEIASNLYDQGNYPKAIEQAEEGLKILQENNLLNEQDAENFINLIGNIYFSMANADEDPLQSMLSNLNKMNDSLPIQNIATAVNIARAKYNIAQHYYKADIANKHDLTLQYVGEALRGLKVVYPNMDHEYFSVMLQFVSDICIDLNINHTERLFKNEEYKNMNIVAKVVYELASEFLSTSENIPTYAISLAASYILVGEKEIGEGILNKVQVAVVNADLEVKNAVEKYISFYLDDDGEVCEDYDKSDVLVTRAQALHSLAKSYLDEKDYQKATKFISDALNMTETLKHKGKLKFEFSHFMSQLSADVEAMVLNHYEDKEFSKGIEIANFTKGAVFLYKDDCYKDQFNGLIALGYYQLNKCKEAKEYFPSEKITECNLSNYDLIQDAVNKCEVMINREDSLVMFRDICSHIGRIDLYECKDYIAGVLQDIAE